LNAARAAFTALSTSSAVPSVTSASGLPVAGLPDEKVFPGAAHLPSMYWPNLLP
jgi:hypothetical protein